MTLPKNALVKQYKKLFEMDGIDFSITPGAIDLLLIEHLSLILEQGV